MSKALEVIALGEGLRTSYEGHNESKTASHSKQQSAARRKRMLRDIDDAEGPPDSQKAFASGQFKQTLPWT